MSDLVRRLLIGLDSEVNRTIFLNALGIGLLILIISEIYCGGTVLTLCDHSELILQEASLGGCIGVVHIIIIIIVYLVLLME